MAQIIWAPKAVDDLESLIAYIAQDAPVTARRFAQKLVMRVESLANHPSAGGYVEEDDTKTYRQVLQGNYRVIYRLDGDKVVFVAVHHAAKLLYIPDIE